MTSSNSKILSREVSIGTKDDKNVKIGGNNPTRIVVPFGISSKKDLKFDYISHLHSLEKNGADIFQELSVFGDYSKMRKELIQNVNIPYGTVLAYEFADKCKKYKSLNQSSMEDILIETLLCQIEHGVDYITIHSSLSKHLISKNKYSVEHRVIGCPSRAGTILKELMVKHNVDNPLNYSFSEIAKICNLSNVVISLGASYRPAAIADAMDMAHINEIRAQGKLVHSVENKPGFLIEGLSHAVPEDIIKYRELCHELCDRYPVTALGPLTIDNAAGMDDVAASIGLVFAINAGISSVNLITRKEHHSMPETKDTIDALKAFKVSIEIANVMREGKYSNRNILLSKAREQLEWNEQKKHLLFPSVIDKYIKLDRSKRQPCKICNHTCPFLRKENLGFEIPNWIFPFWRRLFCELTNFLELNKKHFQSAYTFGSLVNGEFIGSEYNGRMIPFSDFEFTFISTNKISKDILDKLKTLKDGLENTAFYKLAKPLFHIDIRIISVEEFNNYDKRTYFWHHLMTNGRTLWGKDLISQNHLLIKPKISEADLFSKITSLLVDFLLVVKPKEYIKLNGTILYDKKIIHSLSTVGSKIGLFFAAAYSGRAPKNISEALTIIEQRDVELYNKIKRNFNIRKGVVNCNSVLDLSNNIKELIYIYINHFFKLKNNTIEEINKLNTSQFINSPKIQLFKPTINLFFNYRFSEYLTLTDEWWQDRQVYFKTILVDLRKNDESFKKLYSYSENYE